MKIKKAHYLIIAVFVALACYSQANAEDKNTSSDSNQRNSNVHQKMCRNLHKVIDVDDLLKQMYDNIDSYCLFDMPTEELESIWGIKVFDFTNLVEKVSDSELKAMTKEEYNTYSKPYDDLQAQYFNYIKTGNGLLVIKKLGGEGEFFEIQPTNSYRLKVIGFLGGNLDKGMFPKWLPAPKIYSLPKYSYSLPNASPDDKPVIVPKNTVYKSMTYYWWVNQDKDINKPFLEILTSPYPMPSSPRFYKQGNKNSQYKYIFN